MVGRCVPVDVAPVTPEGPKLADPDMESSKETVDMFTGVGGGVVPPPPPPPPAVMVGGASSSSSCHCLCNLKRK